MVFTGLATLVQTQWVALCSHLHVHSEAEREQRRRDRRARRQLRRQRKAARRAARRSRRERKGSAAVVDVATLGVAPPPPPPATVTSAGDKTKLIRTDSTASSSESSERSERPAILEGQAWAATAAAMALATSEASALESQRRSPECVPPPAAASFASSASLEASVKASAKAAAGLRSDSRASSSSGPETLAMALALPRELPRELTLEQEQKQLEQKQREFYDSLGGYSTVDEEDDELHELLANKNPAAAGGRTLVASVQEEQVDAAVAALLPVQKSAGPSKTKTPESPEELLDTEPEDDDVDLRDGYSSFGEDDDERLRGASVGQEPAMLLLEAKPKPEMEAETEPLDEEEAVVNRLLEVDVDGEELPSVELERQHMQQGDKVRDASPMQQDEDEDEELLELVAYEDVELEDVDLEGQVLLEEVVEIIDEYEEDVALSRRDEDLFGQSTPASPSPLGASDTLFESSATGGVYNPGVVDEYASSILANLRAHEAQYQVTEDIFAQQPSVRPKMRAVLVDWLVEVHQRFELEIQTLYLTVNYIDRYLAQVAVKPQRLQLVGVTALLIASKFEEIYPCDMDDLLYICERTYSKTDLVDCERAMLNAFRFNLAAPSVSSFLGYFLAHFQDDELVGHLANYFSERALLDFSFGATHKPSVVAASCLLLAMCYVENQSPALVWSSRLVELTGLRAEELEACPQDLWETLSIRSELTAVATKYSAEELGGVATLPLDDLEALLF